MESGISNPEYPRSSKGSLKYLFDRKSRFLLFVFVILAFLFISGLYFFNLLGWSQGPDFGWSITDQSGSLVLVDVTGMALQAGLKKGDRIVGVNGVGVSTYGELRQNLDRQIGQKNVYHVLRDGEAAQIPVPNVPLGFRKAFFLFGITWLVGLIFFLLGAVVVIMKPTSRASWAFLVLMFNAGISITFNFTSTFKQPFMNNFFMYAQAFVPASLIQLSLTFPEERKWFTRNPLFFWAPWLASALLFVLMRSSAAQYSDLPMLLMQTCALYFGVSLILFLGSVVYTVIKSSSVLARVRSRVILMGTIAATALPFSDLVLILFTGKGFIPHPLYNLPFTTLLPVFIAYAIVKHNLFDVDVFIKRTVGYALMTVLVGMVYFSLQVSVRSMVARSPFSGQAETIYPVFFALLVVFLFNPVNRRVQGAVDRLFYRKKFDYKDTVISVSNALTTMLDVDQILKKIIDTVRKDMFIDNAGVIMLRPDNGGCEALYVEDDETGKNEKIREEDFPPDDPLIQLVSREKKLITRYDVEEGPSYADVQKESSRRFSELGATLAMPLKVQDQITGVLTVGQKKSGHFYSSEDIDLLKTLSNQGAVALENARLIEQMKREEVVRANLARYLSPQIVDQVLKNDVEVNLGGDRKTVTVLISDIRGFTTISETWPANELIMILNEYFTEMARIIFENQGSLDKYIGDAVVAVFGSLIPLENPARNAVRTAVEMIKRMPELNKKWASQFDGFTMEIGIGLNTGEVFLGNVGSPERMEFTVIGDTVNVASRFCDLAGPGQVLITRETREALGGEFSCNPMPPERIKGKSDRMEVIEVVCG